MYPVSDAFKAAVAGVHTAVAKIEVWNSGSYLATLDNALTSGASVSFDETREIRRTFTLPLGGTDYMPGRPGDLLYPASCNELYPFRGVQYADGSIEWCPLGVFELTIPKSNDDANSASSNPSLTVSGQDRASVISAIIWQQPYCLPDGISIGEAFIGVLNDRWPGAPLTFNVDSSAFDVVLAAQTLGADISGANDPMADVINFCATGGFEALFDVTGAAVCRPISDPTTAPVVAQLVEGPNCTMTQAGRSLDATATKNGVIAIGNGVSGAPIQVEVWNTDPTSQINYLSKWGQRPMVITTTAIPSAGQDTDDATAQLLALAQAQLQLVIGALDITNFSMAPDPSLQEGDCVEQVRSRLKIADTYVLSSGVMPLDVDTLMTGTNRPRIQTS